MIELTPNYSAGRTRRPIGHREDAQRAYIAPHVGTWELNVQYIGAWMRWIVTARRRSWGYNGREYFVLRSGLIGPTEWQDAQGRTR